MTPTETQIRALASLARSHSTAQHTKHATRAQAIRDAHSAHVSTETLRNAKAKRTDAARESQRVARHASEVGLLDALRAVGSARGELREIGDVRDSSGVHLTGTPMGNVNPNYDASDNVKARRDAKVTRATYREFIYALAYGISEKYVRRAKTPCAHLLPEFVTECESAIGLAIALRTSRFPSLASDLLARFACNALPDTTRRALTRAALKACDARLRRMSGNTVLVETAFFHLLPDDGKTELDGSKQDTRETLARIDARFTELRARIQTKMTAGNGNTKRHAQAHLRFLDSARAYFVASVQGESAKLPAHGLTRERETVGTHKTAFTFAPDIAPEVQGPRLSHDKAKANPLSHATWVETGEVTEETGDQTLSASALYKRISRLAEFVGSPEITRALSVTRHR